MSYRSGPGPGVLLLAYIALCVVIFLIKETLYHAIW